MTFQVENSTDSIIQHDNNTNAFRIVVVTPLMRRCHDLRSSGVMVRTRIIALSKYNCKIIGRYSWIHVRTSLHMKTYFWALLCAAPLVVLFLLECI